MEWTAEKPSGKTAGEGILGERSKHPAQGHIDFLPSTSAMVKELEHLTQDKFFFLNFSLTCTSIKQNCAFFIAPQSVSFKT